MSKNGQEATKNISTLDKEIIVNKIMEETYNSVDDDIRPFQKTSNTQTVMFTLCHFHRHDLDQAI